MSRCLSDEGVVALDRLAQMGLDGVKAELEPGREDWIEVGGPEGQRGYRHRGHHTIVLPEEDAGLLGEVEHRLGKHPQDDRHRDSDGERE